MKKHIANLWQREAVEVSHLLPSGYFLSKTPSDNLSPPISWQIGLYTTLEEKTSQEEYDALSLFWEAYKETLLKPRYTGKDIVGIKEILEMDKWVTNLNTEAAEKAAHLLPVGAYIGVPPRNTSEYTVDELIKMGYSALYVEEDVDRALLNPFWDAYNVALRYYQITMFSRVPDPIEGENE